MMNQFTRVIHNFFRAIDPLIGASLLAAQTNIYGIRVDGRMPDKIHLQDGFPAILGHDEILAITQARLERYQTHNMGRIGLGAVASYDHLHQDYHGNPHVEATRCIYGFFGKAVYLPGFNAKLLGERTEAGGYEREYVLLEAIAFNHILFATTPEHRQAFESGLRVPNEMMTYNARLPAYLTKAEINDLQTTLAWLLDNSATQTASELCKCVFREQTLLNISEQLDGNSSLIQEVERLLANNIQGGSVDEQLSNQNTQKFGI